MYPTAEYPGYGSFVKNVCYGLSHYNHSVSYSSLIKGRHDGFINKLLAYLKFYISIIINFFKKYDYIYIHFPNHAIPVLSLLYKFKKQDIVVNFHGEDLLYENTGYTGMLGRLTENFCKRYASAIVVPSQYYKQIVANRCLIDNDKIIVSPSGGIDSKVFCRNNNIKDDSIIHLGCVGRLEKDKGICEFLTVCKDLHTKLSFKATIIGYGSLYEETLRFIQTNNLNEVELIKGVPQSELGAYYNKFSLLIFSSSRTSESLGLTGIESMACGTPVIGSNIGGIVSYLNHGVNGWVVPVKDTTSIIKSIYDYLDMSSEDKETMIENCISTGKRYYRGVVCEELSNNINRVLYNNS